MENSKEDIIKTYTDNLKKKRSVGDLENYLNKIMSSIKKLNILYCNEYDTSFFTVLTRELKEQLLSKAKDIKSGFLKKISQNVEKSINGIEGKYNKMCEQLRSVPQKEEELIQLNKNIENCDNELKKLEKEIQDTYQYILLMERYGQQFEENAMIKYWLLKVCPLEVKIASTEAKKTSNDKEKEFVSILEEQKTKFESDITTYKLEFDRIKKFKKFSNVENASISSKLASNLENAKERRKDFNRREEIFKIAKSVYENLDKVCNDFVPYKVMWERAFDFDTSRETWMVANIVKLNYNKITNELDKIKSDINRNLIKRFEEEGNMNALQVCEQIKEEIKSFEKNLSLIEFMTKDCMVKKKNNWKNLFIKLNLKLTQQTSLKKLIELKVNERIEEIEDFVSQVEEEYKQELKLDKNILDNLKTLKLEIIPHKATNSFLLTRVEEIQTKLDEYLNVIMMMKQSPHIKQIKRKVEEVERKLIGMEDMLEEWIRCQRSWLYLQPIFISEDLKKKMSYEKNLFDQVDKLWRVIMNNVVSNPKIFENFDWEKTKLDFENSNITLDKVQKSLSDYLEAKRSEFPRFYFLSDDELIEIISETKDPTLVTKYLSKCFEGINSLEFRNKEEIISFMSSENEKIFLNKPINVNEGDKKGNVEKWLGELQDNMKETMKLRALECYKDLKEKRSVWLKKWPGQLILAINSTRWTSNVENAIYEGSLFEFNKKMNEELSEIVELVRKPLTSLERNTLSALIVIDVHASYVLNELIKKNVNSVDDFYWISQLRYAMNKKNNLEIKIMTSTYNYQYEYLGNSSRLVITPLTDRCYRTLMNAYQFFYGGAPEGPAGTGKTETVKDLAKAVAVQCNVFNCTDQINYVAMNKFFNGLTQTGSWCCFDEFNRIIPEVLSVIAVQVRSIQNAIKEKKTSFFFEGKNIKLVDSCAINITMNPGYAGRSALPDNLKALFRPCAMMVPNYSLIAEICLYSYGFQKANSLSKKIVVALKLSSEQLSSQKHYDFGMRALKSILVAAGNLKKTYPNELEEKLCLKALKNVNIPKFTLNDIPLFNSIILDLFPGVEDPKKSWQDLSSKMVAACEKFKIIPKESFLKKAIEIYEMLLVRHGLMVVGKTYSGKTNCLKVLREGLIGLNNQIEIRKINPKSVTGTQLYGFLDPNTKAWTEGVIPQVMKECEKDADKEEYKWVIFDGPVDACWIENMNTVLDDNKILCLTNGQKIKLTKWMTMMFEVEDLDYASPATVSRCGMIYMEPDQLNWKTLVEKFGKFELHSKMVNFKKTVIFNLNWLLSTVLAYAKKYCKLPLEINDLKIVDNCLKILNILLKEYESIHGLDKFKKDFENRLSDICLFSIIWGVGGIFSEKCRKDLNIFLLKLIYYEDVRESYKIKIEFKNWEPRGLPVQLKDIKDLFSIKFDVERMIWTKWIEKDDLDISTLKNLKFQDLIIPTADSMRNSYFLQSIIKYKGHILLTGQTGTGKTIGALKDIENHYNSKKIGNLCINFSGQTLVNAVQNQIVTKMTTRKGKKGFGPEENKEKMIVFIDDINMPAKEEYGAQPAIELLRMWMDHKFWYDLETKEEKYLEDMQFISTMGPPSTGRNTMTSRFLRHFYLLYVIPFDDDSMFKIYDSIMEWHFVKTTPKFFGEILDLKSSIVKSSLYLYNKIKNCKELLPTPNKSHYIFSMRDLTRIFQTIAKSTHRSFKKGEDFIKLWAHESMRVFMDRLVNKKDKQLFKTILDQTIKKNFKLDWKNLVKQEPLLWADFVPTYNIDNNGKKKIMTGIYVELKDKENLPIVFNKFLNDYNESKMDKLNLVLFIEAIEHIIKIIRVISTQYSHSLLVGMGGLGRRSLASLAAYIGGFSLKSIEMGNNYGKTEWIKDLQDILKYAGVDDIETVFLFNDTQIFNEDILEDISSLLAQGEVPGLFPNDEKMKIMEELMSNNDEKLISMTNNEKFNFFIRKCKENLHLVLCFSPVGDNLRRRIRNFPSFINNTTINWFMPWPETALNAVARTFLNTKDFPVRILNDLSDITVQMQNSIYKLADKFLIELRRHYYVTPTSYLELLNMFKKVLRDRTKKIKDNLNRYEDGVETLIKSKKDVEKMKRDISELEPKLEKATIETEKLIEKVEKEQIEADEKRKNCKKEETICNKNRKEAEELKESCENELNKVKPLLIAATKNLKSIQRNHIDFLKQIKTPLPPIKKLYKGLCIFYKIKNIPLIKDPNNPYKKIPDYLPPTRNIIMAKPSEMINYLTSINDKTINKMSINIIKDLKELQKDPDFNIVAITKVSEAAGKIAGFLNTVVEIYDKLQIINPKKENLKKAENDLLQAQEKLNEKQNELIKVTKRIDELKNNLNAAKEKSDKLEQDLQRCKRRSSAAEKLVSGLQSEKISWSKNIEELKKEENTIIGDSLLASGIMSYLGIFPIDYRQEIINEWKNLLKNKNLVFNENFELTSLMENEITIGNWTNKFELPNDSYSITNAIMLKNSSRFCLMIDPQNQANRWIRNMEKENKLIILNPNQKSTEIQNYIQNAIEIGIPVLLEDVDEKLDSNVMSVFNNRRKEVGKKIKFKFLDQWIVLSPNFNFYVTSKLSKPHYSPEICVVSTLLNFKVTPLGLEDQMLNILVAKEEPQIEKNRKNNIKEFYQLKKKQKITEDTILNSLTKKSDQNLLDNKDLIETLQKSKKDAKDAALRLRDIEIMKRRLQNTRNFYLKAANRASNLFFCVTDLGNVEPMYQYSLDWFILKYQDALNVEPKIKETRVDDIIRIFTKMLFTGITASLFEKDKLLFSFLIYIKTLQCENMTSISQLRKLFVDCTRIIAKNENELKNCLTDLQWAKLEQLCEEKELKNLLPIIKKNKNDWINYFKSENIYKEEIPNKYEINDINHLRLMRILAPNLVIPLIQIKIEKLLGKDFVDYPSLNIENIYPETRNDNPIIYILSSGSEPLADIDRLAEILGKGKNIDVLSLGQGQEKIAEESIKYAKTKGKWIVLQNCHLAPKFLSKIESLIEKVENPEFRLWLTSMPTDKFPVTLLQKGIKITSEPPRGIKANVLKNYNTFSNNFLEKHPKTMEWKKLVFGLTFFHSIVQERRKFSSLGWNIPYEFSQMDLTISLEQTKSMLKDFEEIPWQTLLYSIAEANYGGRVTDPMDRRLINVILSQFIGPHCLNKNYKYSESGVYFCPEETDLNSYKSFIKENFPYNDSPEVFGLHSNAEITFGIKETNNLMVTLLDLLPRQSSSDGESVEIIIQKKAEEILEKIPKKFIIEKIEEDFPIKYENSMNTVLIQELIRYNRLTKKIKSSLEKLIKAVQGFGIMTEELDEVFNKLLNNKVPDSWAQFAYPSEKPLSSWILNLLERIEFIQNWVEKGQPSAFWISGFFFTQSFLTGILQNYSRKYKIPIDTLTFEFKILPKSMDKSIPPESGSYIYGLFLEGAIWNEKLGIIEDSNSKLLYSEMPYIHIIPKKISEKIEVHSYSCPVYKTKVRAGTLSTTGHSTNYVINVDIPIDKKYKSDFWIKRGVALLCELDT